VSFVVYSHPRKKNLSHYLQVRQNVSQDDIRNKNCPNGRYYAAIFKLDIYVKKRRKMDHNNKMYVNEYNLKYIQQQQQSHNNCSCNDTQTKK